MRHILILLFYLGLSVSNAHAATVFYDNLTGFNSASTTSLTDFEGIVNDSDPGGTTSASTFTFDGNVYRNLTGLDMLICGKDICVGNPFDSALMLANFDGGTLRIDLKDNITAVGGLFGDLDGPTGMGTLSVYNSVGLVDTQAVDYGDMGALLEKTFFGWTTTNTVFTALEFAIDPANGGQWSAVDNFQYGSESLSQVPVPASIWLFGTALIGFVGFGKRKARAAA